MNLSLISKYRTELMGVATILIVVCHAPLYKVQLSPIILKLVGFGNVGVDMFLFLSGIGCFYSLDKGGINNLRCWYRRRFYKIFIPYALMQVPYWIYYIAIGNFDILDSMFEFSTLAFWVRHTGMWYIALLIPLYLLTPSIFEYINKRNRYIRGVILSLLILILCEIPLEFNGILDDIVSNVQWAFVRVISFIIGMTIARDVMANKELPVWTILLLPIITFCILKLMGVSHYWCLFPIIIYISVNLFKSSFLRTLFAFMGTISLEMYLSNGYIRYIFMDSPIYTTKSIIFYGHYLDYFIIFIISLMLSYLVKILSDRFYEFKHI